MGGIAETPIMQIMEKLLALVTDYLDIGFFFFFKYLIRVYVHN